jgi:hypothetical protein
VHNRSSAVAASQHHFFYQMKATNYKGIPDLIQNICIEILVG